MPKKDIIIKDGLIVNAGTNTKKLHVDPESGNVIISGSLDVSGDVVVQGTIASGSEAEFGISATNPNFSVSPGAVTGSGDFTLSVTTPDNSSNNTSIATTAFVKNVALTNLNVTGAASASVLIGDGVNYSSNAISGDITLDHTGSTSLSSTSIASKITLSSADLSDLVLVSDASDGNKLKNITVDNLVGAGSFTSLAVSGQTTLNASTEKSLTVVAGQNVTLTTNEPSSTLTINSLGSGSVEDGGAQMMAFYPSAGSTVASASTVIHDPSGDAFKVSGSTNSTFKVPGGSSESVYVPDRIKFNSDQDTGIRRSTDNRIRFEAGSVDYLVIGNSSTWFENGNVGIGFSPSSDPTHKLHVSGSDGNILKLVGLPTGSGTTALVVDGDGVIRRGTIPLGAAGGSTTSSIGTGNRGNIPYYHLNGTNVAAAGGLNWMNNKLGVNTSDPSNLLHVSSTSDPVRFEGLQTDATLGTLIVVDSTDVLHKTTTLPSLNVDGYITATGSFELEQTGSGTVLKVGTSADANLLNVASTGGVKTHKTMWHFSGPSTFSPTALSDTRGWEIYGGGTPRITSYDRNSSTYLQAHFDALSYKFDVGGSSKVYIGTQGQLSVGASTPESYWSESNHLVLQGTASAGMTIRSAGSNSGYISFADSDSGTARYAGLMQYNHGSDKLFFFVGENITTPKLEISATSVSSSVELQASGLKLDALNSTTTDTTALVLASDGTVKSRANAIGGTVSSIGVTGGTGIDVSGGPVTTSGSVALSLNAPQVTALVSGSITISASQVNDGVFDIVRIPTGSINLPASQITSGQFADARISETSVTQYSSQIATAVATEVLTDVSMSGTPSAPTPLSSSDDNTVATTAFVQSVAVEAAGQKWYAVEVDGQSPVLPDSATSTLTFANGTGIEITTSPAGDSITISSTLAGGTVTSIGMTGSNGLNIAAAEGLPITGSGQIQFTMGDITPTTVKATSSGNATTPALGITGSGASVYGLYSIPGAEQLGVTVSGTAQVLIDDTKTVSARSGQWGLLHEDPTATNPNIVPVSTDPDTGIGASGSNNLSLIAGGTEAMRLTPTGLSSSLNLSASAFYGDGSNLTNIAADVSAAVLGTRKTANTKLYLSPKVSGSTHAHVGAYDITISGANTGSTDVHFSDTQPFDFTHPYNYVQIGADSVNWSSKLGTSGDFTFEFFAKTDNIGPYDIFNWPTAGIEIKNPSVGPHAPGIVVLGLGSVWTIQDVFPTGQWIHFALVRSDGTATLYVDGVSKGTRSSSNTWPSGTGKFTLGADPSTNVGWDGRLDEIHLTHEALYTGNFTPPTQRADYTQKKFFLEDLANVSENVTSGSTLTYDGIMWQAATGGSSTLSSLVVTGQITADSLSVAGTASAETISGSNFYADSDVFEFRNKGTQPSEIRLYCETNNAHYTGIRGPLHSGGESYILKVPNTPPTDNQILKVSGTPSGTPKVVTLEWEDDGSSSVATAFLSASVGGTTLTSSATAKTLTFAAGSNITLSATASTNTVTINSSGGSTETLNDIGNVDTTGLASGSIIKYNGTSWVISTDATGGGGSGGGGSGGGGSGGGGEGGGGEGGGSSNHTSSATPPGSPATGDWWYDNQNNVLYNRVTDGAGTAAWIDVSTATSTLVIKDADGDTKVQVEQSADEDKIRFDTSGVERMIIDQTGSIGIGVASPAYPIHHSSGAHLTTGGVWTDNSSRASKKNIRNITGDEAMAAFKKLEPVRFEYKRGNEPHCGFIAEDVPELVASPNRHGLSSMDIVSVLTKVVQKQQDQMEQQQAQIDELRKLLQNK